MENHRFSDVKMCVLLLVLVAVVQGKVQKVTKRNIAVDVRMEAQSIYH